MVSSYLMHCCSIAFDELIRMMFIFVLACQDTLLYTRYSSIMEFDVYTRRVTVLVDVESSFVYGIDYDYKNRFIYFPRFNTHQIVRYVNVNYNDVN